MTLVSKNFNQIIDFTRTSAATYVNSSGLIAQTPASVNLLTYTQEFDNAAWSKVRSSVTANALVAPDGTTTADKLVEDTTATSSHFVAQTCNFSSGFAYTYSFYAKAAERNWFVIQVSSAAIGANKNASFDLINGVLGTVDAGLVAAISAVGGGWYRCSVTFTTTASGSGAVAAVGLIATANNTLAYTGDGTSGIYLWGAQLEQASAASTYTRNYGGLYPPRFDYDPVTLAPKGLLVEEQRTNLLTYSSDYTQTAWVKNATTITANATTAPDGTATADLVVPSTASSLHSIAQTLTLANSTSYTYSIYAKAAGYSWVAIEFYDGTTYTYANANISTGAAGTVSGSLTLKITQVANGFYRISVTGTTAATGTPRITPFVLQANATYTYAGDGTSGVYLWGAQAEAGAFATSYIPTTSAQVTRTADIPVIQSPNFAPWFNAAQGTFVVQADAFVPLGSTTSYRAFSANDGTVNNSIEAYIYNSKWGGVVRVASVAQADLSQAASYAQNTSAKIAVAYQQNNFGVSVNGNTTLTDTSGTIPTVDRLSIGNAAALPLNGHIQSIKYYPTRLTNAQLQALTT